MSQYYGLWFCAGVMWVRLAYKACNIYWYWDQYSAAVKQVYFSHIISLYLLISLVDCQFYFTPYFINIWLTWKLKALWCWKNPRFWPYLSMSFTKKNSKNVCRSRQTNEHFKAQRYHGFLVSKSVWILPCTRVPGHDVDENQRDKYVLEGVRHLVRPALPCAH